LASILSAIVSRHLAGSGCIRVLSGDGVTTSDLSIKGIPGIFGAASVPDMRTARKSMPAIGQTASIAKNLDEFQFRICSLVPSLPDNDPRKMMLQKYRVGAIAAFARLAAILNEPESESLARWNTYARPLMEGASDAYLKARSNSNLQVTIPKDAFEFFGVPEDKIDAALAAFYA
jgi:hypothetical protein